MIGYLKGIVVEVAEDSALMDVGGVGYEILASANTLSDLQGLLSKEVIVWIHTHVREDAFQLFGFHSKEEKNLFLSLLKVNGVGPKMALSILSGGRVEQIHEMIESSNAKALSSLPKVGKKTAEQIILTLKGKLVLLEPKTGAKKKMLVAHPEITSALLNLGFKPQAVEQFVATLPKDAGVEDGVRKGLAALSQPL
ncbi:Holliday junction branch migration protein RuvA [Bdellovibrio sp. HCB337]|uniref:Holliday junction branch migration protein RuvA n=1 Tax=Bdellovibrio sp. HCB337 TaxID=3394358 RepID=UPI0039A4C7ED